MGGHAFMTPGERGTHEQAIRNAREVGRALMTFVERGYNVVVTLPLEVMEAFQITDPVALDIPIGATGTAQICELTWQLRGEAGDRQVKGANVAVSHCLGGASVFAKTTGSAAMSITVLAN